MRRILTMLSIVIVIGVIGGNEHALAGIDGGGAPKTSKGKLTQFGSVYVNGVRFDTASALFLIDGEFGTEADLEVGQIVTVVGATHAGGATGTAYLVIYEDVVSGPVAELDRQQNRMTVLGQTVIVDDDTSFSIPGVHSLDDLGTPGAVEVSGHVRADGTVLATHVAAADNGAFDVEGIVTAVDSAQYTLTIAGLDVDFGSANLHGFESGVPTQGDRVEVRGSTLSSTGTFIASRVERSAPTLAAIPGDDVALEGLITRYAAPWDFDVDGTRVAIHWGTQFENGWLFDLGHDVKVDIRGSLGSDDRLHADVVEFESAGTADLVGYVSNVTGDAITVDGRTLRLSPETEYLDESDDNAHRFGAGDLRSSDRVHVRYYVDDGESVATRVVRRDVDEDDDDDEDED